VSFIPGLFRLPLTGDEGNDLHLVTNFESSDGNVLLIVWDPLFYSHSNDSDYEDLEIPFVLVVPSQNSSDQGVSTSCFHKPDEVTKVPVF
jgi:hypothetical protein